MNPGGVRADLLFAGSAAGEGDGVVTYGELFTVQPFGNGLLTMTSPAPRSSRRSSSSSAASTRPPRRVLAGAAAIGRVPLHVDPVGHRGRDCATADAVDPACITLNGVPLDPAATYRVTVNTFLADGGDGFTVLREGTNRFGGAVDTDAFEQYLAANADGLAPPADGPHRHRAVAPRRSSKVGSRRVNG